jgi:formylglycine-generating enzyme required for sulfatase activity
MKRTIYAYSIIVFIAVLLLYGCSNPNEPDAKIVAAPSFNPSGGGTYTTAQNVTISCATEGATIFYSIDGSTPSIPYNGPVNIAATATLKAKASKSGWTDSQITSAVYNINITPNTVATPTFNPPGGETYTTAQNVTISCATEGATIFYSIDGSTPSILYNEPVNIAATATLKAKASKSGWTDSQITSATYTISAPPPPVQMIYVPGGTFTMGRTTGSGFSHELPTHTVTLNSFYIGKFEVTQAEYSQYMQPGSSWTSGYGLGDNYPAYYVSWYAILKYCNLRSIAEGLTPCYTINGSTNPANWGAVPTDNNDAWDAAICDWNANGYRLPTEAEWEYAARGATNNPDYLYSGSDDINAVAWYDGNNSTYGSKPVGTKSPNGIGTNEMSGNVYEWCWDWYSSSYYSNSPQNNPTGPASGSYRVRRGGCWYSGATLCRVALRFYYRPDYSYDVIGFRLCRSAN